MYIVFRDTIGLARYDDIGNISFLDDKVYFECGMDDCILWANQVVEIGHDD